MQIRPLTPEDADELACLHKDGFDVPWTSAAIAGLLTQPYILGWGIQSGSEDVLGAFMLVQITEDEAEILTLATASAHRRQGLAYHLVEHACDILYKRGIERLHLEVAADNLQALALYRSCRFSQSGQRPNYYRRSDHRVDAILMSRQLTGQSGHNGPSNGHGPA